MTAINAVIGSSSIFLCSDSRTTHAGDRAWRGVSQKITPHVLQRLVVAGLGNVAVRQRLDLLLSEMPVALDVAEFMVAHGSDLAGWLRDFTHTLPSATANRVYIGGFTRDGAAQLYALSSEHGFEPRRVMTPSIVDPGLLPDGAAPDQVEYVAPAIVAPTDASAPEMTLGLYEHYRRVCIEALTEQHQMNPHSVGGVVLCAELTMDTARMWTLHDLDEVQP